MAYAGSPVPRLVSAESWRAMDAVGRRALQQQLTKGASEERGYVYCTFTRQSREAAATQEPEFLDVVLDFWRGERGVDTSFQYATTISYQANPRSLASGTLRPTWPILPYRLIFGLGYFHG